MNNNTDTLAFILSFIASGYATYYAATALAERGVFDVFARLRLPIFVKYQQALDIESHGRVKHWLWELVTCPRCLSIYVATLPTYIYLTPTFHLDTIQSILTLFAVAGLSRWLYAHE